jgi:phosphoribosylformimino-5-aminoimidazole carboxamide ribotide isomerase
MLIIPTIYLQDGQCVPSKEDIVKELAFSPTQIAEKWLSAGAQWLHLVDLNGMGKSKNLPAIRQILEVVGQDIPIQLGGGIDSLETIEHYLDAGVRYIVIGTAAIKTPGFLHEACDAFPGQIIVSLQAKAGKVMTDGWAKITHHEVIDLAKRFEGYGVEAMIYTDKGCDGTLGIHLDASVKLAQALHIPVMVMGEIKSLDEVRTLCTVEEEGIVGLIQATYQGVDFTAAQILADALKKKSS